MSTATTGRRTHHPFHMYEAIHAQPDAFARIVERTAGEVDRCAARLAESDRLFLVGIGTSHHATQTGAHLIQVYGGGLRVHAVHSFDFALYGPPITRRDAVIAISHRGTKRYTVESLRRAADAGCATVLITGEGEASGKPPADVVFRTVSQESSAAHTISYTGSVAVLSSLAARLGHHRTGTSPITQELLREEIPAALRAAFDTERIVSEWARENVGRRRIWLTGGGPGAVTAQEIALKIKETSYLQAEGQQVEAFIHGPFQGTEAEDLFVLIAPAGPAQPRLIEFAGAIREIGAAYLVVSDGTPASLRPQAAGWCTVPSCAEPFTALTCLVPLQLFTYHLALTRGTNPDTFRLDDPRFARAYAPIKL
jgi:glutamine---fructose-6-phosphate transaminase (isomerizing)